MSAFYWKLADLASAVNGQIVMPEQMAEESQNSVIESTRFARVVTDSRAVADAALQIEAEHKAVLSDVASLPTQPEPNNINPTNPTNSSGSCAKDSCATVLYVAVCGERFDGHDFVELAVQQGAQLVLVSKVQKGCSAIQVVVEDTRIALGQFASWHRQQMPLKALVGITGSNGKTTTKTMILALLSELGHTLATQGNLNNDFGVPRTLLEIRPEHDYAVIEMGANHRGEIRYLTHLAKPDIALLNNASGAHLEGFGSLQGVIETKGELFEGLGEQSPYGIAVLNQDSDGLDYWLKTIPSLAVKRLIRFGRLTKNPEVEAPETVAFDALPHSEVFWHNLETSMDGIGLQVRIQDQENAQQFALNLPVLGEHNAYNAAASIAVAWSLGASQTQIQHALAEFSGVAGRLQIERLAFGRLIDDSYNANPASVKAGIKVIASLEGRAVLCLGAMAELGETGLEQHLEVAQFAAEQGIEALFFYSQDDELGQKVAECFMQTVTSHDSKAKAKAKVQEKVPAKGAFFAQAFTSHSQLNAALTEYLTHQMGVSSGLVNILVKGSRSAKMETVVGDLQKFSQHSLLSQGVLSPDTEIRFAESQEGADRALDN